MDHARVVTVVCGVPRSGTSLLMHMLRAGGMPILSDDTRPADAGNPNGYFEYDPARRAAHDNTWVDAAVGKAVKVVHVLLPSLPRRLQYRVLFARRDMGEIIASQQTVLDRLGRRGARIPPARLAETFSAQVGLVLRWANEQSHINLLNVDYCNVITDPFNQARRMNEFLGGHLDEAAMAAAVDPSLYRQRAAAIPQPERSPCAT